MLCIEPFYNEPRVRHFLERDNRVVLGVEVSPKLCLFGWVPPILTLVLPVVVVPLAVEGRKEIVPYRS